MFVSLFLYPYLERHSEHVARLAIDVSRVCHTIWRQSWSSPLHPASPRCVTQLTVLFPIVRRSAEARTATVSVRLHCDPSDYAWPCKVIILGATAVFQLWLPQVLHFINPIQPDDVATLWEVPNFATKDVEKADVRILKPEAGVVSATTVLRPIKNMLLFESFIAVFERTRIMIKFVPYFSGTKIGNSCI